MEGHYRFTDTQNQFRVIPLDLVDIKATQLLNSDSQSVKAAQVLTNDDLSSKASSAPKAGGAVEPNPPPPSPGKPDSTVQVRKGEAEWRAQAKQIRDQIARVEKQIEALQEKQKSAKADGIKIGFDTYNQVIYANFESEVKELEKEKEKLQQMMNSLEEEARKAGALPGWLR
jgi:hypothetical protein